MMSGFSPLTRRFLAIALVVLALLLGWTLIVQPLAGQTERSLSRLEQSRFLLARAEGLVAAPLPDAQAALPPGLAYRASDRAAATDAFSAQVAALLLGGAASVEAITPIDGKGSTPLAMQLVVIGPEADVARFIAAAERARPIIRFADWRLEVADPAAGTVKFSATALAAWTTP